jgi:hypothetical protein
MRLLTLKTNEEILELVDQMDRESKALKEEILRACWYMRGGLTYNEGMELGFEEREIISRIIKDNMETTKKSGLPFF